MQLTENFRRDEFRCRCRERKLDKDDTWCHGDSWVHYELVMRLQQLRDHFKSPVTITSGCRCPRYNLYVGGAPMSQHKRGTAADIVVQGRTPKEVARVARELGLFVIEYPTFTHVDIRNYI